MKNESYFQHTKQSKKQRIVDKNINIDVAIIGGGLTGVLTAYYLKDTPLRIAVFEKDTIGSGTSGHTTGKLTSLHGLMYQKLLKKYGKQTALDYYLSNQEAIEEVRSIIKKYDISCDYKQVNNYVYTNMDENIKLIQSEIEACESLGIPYIDGKDFHIPNQACIGFEHQAIFHPLKYLVAIVEICKEAGVCFYEHSEVTKIQHVDLMQECLCNDHVIHSIYTVVATRYPLPIDYHNYTMKLQQSMAHLYYIKTSKKYTDTSICIDPQSDTHRDVEGGIITGGYSHDVGVTKNIPYHQQATLYWSSQDSMSLRLLPYIGYYYNKEVFCFVACGYNKWGMSFSHVAAKLLSALICQKDHPYQTIYDPLQHAYRFDATRLWELTKNNFQGYISNRLQTTMYDHHFIDGKVVRTTSGLRAMAMDEHKKIHYIRPVCSHKYGVLNYNKEDKTWDCKCHGSRFSITGKVVQGPAKQDLEVFESLK